MGKQKQGVQHSTSTHRKILASTPPSSRDDVSRGQPVSLNKQQRTADKKAAGSNAYYTAQQAVAEPAQGMVDSSKGFTLFAFSSSEF